MLVRSTDVVPTQFDCMLLSRYLIIELVESGLLFILQIKKNNIKHNVV